MKTVGMRELKQNPNEIIERVLESREELELTSHGRPTGVKLTPVARGRATWVSADALARVTPLDDSAAARYRDASAMLESEPVADPWAPES